jgi:hypothetical protein
MVQEVITQNSAMTKNLKDFIVMNVRKLFKTQHKAVRFRKSKKRKCCEV